MDWQTFTTVWGFNIAFFVVLPLTFVGIYLGVKSLPRSRMAYAIQTLTIIDDTWSSLSKEIKVTYDGLEIRRMTLSNVYIWNDGNQIIRRSDITPKSPIAFRLPEGQHLLQYSVVSMTDDAIDAEIDVDDQGAARLNFEYLDPCQGIKCVFVHSGTENDLIFSGILMGAKAPARKRLRSDALSLQGFLILMFLIFIPQIAAVQFVIKPLRAWDPDWLIPALLFFSGTMLAWAFFVYQAIKRYNSSEIDFGKNAHTAFQMPNESSIIIPGDISRLKSF